MLNRYTFTFFINEEDSLLNKKKLTLPQQVQTSQSQVMPANVRSTLL